MWEFESIRVVGSGVPGRLAPVDINEKNHRAAIDPIARRIIQQQRHRARCFWGAWSIIVPADALAPGSDLSANLTEAVACSARLVRLRWLGPPSFKADVGLSLTSF